MISVWPKFYVNTTHFQELSQIGAIFNQSVNDNLKDWVGPGYVFFIL